MLYILLHIILQKNIQDAEQWLRRLECELVSLEDECIAIESTLCSLRKLQDTENVRIYLRK